MITFGDSVRLGLGFVLLLAGIQKTIGLDTFRIAVAQYTVIPSRVTTLVVWAVVCFEAMMGLCLLVGYQPRVALMATGVLFVLFGMVISGELLRGRRIECGCFGGGGGIISWELPIRNLLAAAVAGAAAHAFSAHSSSAFPELTTLASGVTAAAALISYATTRTATRLLRRGTS